MMLYNFFSFLQQALILSDNYFPLKFKTITIAYASYHLILTLKLEKTRQQHLQ